MALSRRGFLGALTAGLASLGVVWPAPRCWKYTKVIRTPFRKTATAASQGDVFYSRPPAGAEFRWASEKIDIPVEDNLYFHASAEHVVIAPVRPWRWQAGDVWMNLDTRETMYVNQAYSDGTVRVMRSVGNNPAARIRPKDKLWLVGSIGDRDYVA